MTNKKKPWRLTRDGVTLLRGNNQSDCFIYLLKLIPYSVSHAIHYEGYDINYHEGEDILYDPDYSPINQGEWYPSNGDYGKLQKKHIYVGNIIEHIDTSKYLITRVYDDGRFETGGVTLANQAVFNKDVAQKMKEWKVTPKACKYCGGIFFPHITSTKLKYLEQKFCSAICKANYNSVGLETSEGVMCKDCGKDLSNIPYSEAIYCEKCGIEICEGCYKKSHKNCDD